MNCDGARSLGALVRFGRANTTQTLIGFPGSSFFCMPRGVQNLPNSSHIDGPDPHDGTTMNTTLRNSILFSSAAIGLIACGAAKDALDGEAQTSYCEAVCDWAVSCSGEADSLDACLEATRAADSNCAAAENGELNPANSALVEDCVATVDTDECSGLTGSVAEQTASAPSAACITSEGTAATDTYDAARTAVQSDGGQFCDDLGASICGNVVDCLIGDLGVGEAEDALLTACEDSAIGALITTCNGVDLDARYGTDPNVNRMAANTCADTLGGLASSCDIFGADAWPEECGAVLVDASEIPALVGNLVTFAEGYDVEVP